MSRKQAEKEKKPEPHLQLRWKNFRSFNDTEWFTIRPITIIVGANNSGKTNLVRPLLLLKQTLDSGDEDITLKITGPLSDVGTYRNVVFGRKTSRNVEFAIRFHNLEDPKKAGKLKPPGAYPPSEIVLQFGMGRNPLEVELRRFEVLDLYGRSCVVRKREASGSYSISTTMKIHPKLRQAAKSLKPSHFMFSGIGVLRRFIENEHDRVKRLRNSKGKRARKEINLDVSGGAFSYVSFLSATEAHISGILSSLKYIGPLRDYPKRFYESTEEVPETVGVRGECAPHVLHLTKNPDTARETSKWLREFGLAREISSEGFQDDLFALKVRDLNTNSKIDYSDSGFGLSQLLPLIVQGLHSKSRELIFLEQPEIHLNPRLQCKLANLFAAIAATNKTLLVETHSEHLIMRIRTLIAANKLKPEQVALYYVEKGALNSTLREIPIDSRGQIKPEQWPVGFFEESLGEALSLARRDGGKNAR